MTRFLGNTDDVTTCDCCGRTGLKSTVALLVGEDATDPVYYGVTCAARALGRTAKEVRTEARAAARAAELARRAEDQRKAAAEDARWQAHLDSKAGTGPDVRSPLGVERIRQIQKLGGYAAARAGYEVRS